MEATRILIADDHPVVRGGLRVLLGTREGWEVCGEAATGLEAVEQAKLLKPDVVIIDISMPEMDGFEAIGQIRALDPKTEILALTMHESEAMFRGVMQAGAHGYVLKSDLDGRLIEAVEALCDHRAYFSPAISQTILQGFFQGRASVHQAAGDPGTLTPRQRQVAQLLVQGKSNKEVATALGISTRTAETHRHQIMTRLKIHSLSELTLFALRHRLIDL
jgi:DNA-binding NarL/FixJ family response regulator